MRIVVAMSGGVDSSVAAALLAEAGHEVIGLSMQLYDQRDGESGYGSCCSLDDLHDAGRVARRLNIPHYIVNFEREFQRTVVANFVDEYVAGRTPIPCAHCNSDLKFATLLDRSMAYGAEVVATGHYARIGIDAETGPPRASPRPRCGEGSVVFPVFAHAGAARRARASLSAICRRTRCATSRGAWVCRSPRSPTARKSASCPMAITPRSSSARPAISRAAAPSSTSRARCSASHGGVHRFTVGQRKGLGIAAAEPMYVLATPSRGKDRRRRAAPRARAHQLTASQVNWIAGDAADGPLRVTAQIRHRHQPAPAPSARSTTTARSMEFDAPVIGDHAGTGGRVL